MLELVRRTRFLDPRLFTAFVAAAELENFTHAARVAHMTQSGVSQHIAKLEELVGRSLFKRIGNRVVLTESGKMLRAYIQTHLAEVGGFFDAIQSEEMSLTGAVSYAMPPSCLLSTHFRDLLEKRKAQPRLQLKVTLASSPQVLELVLENNVDFGFMTVKPEHPAIAFEGYCDEEYILVGSDRQLMRGMRPEDLFEQLVISYPGSDVYYNMWIRHHLRGDRRDHHSLMTAGEINALAGAVTMAVGGLGMGVFPRHCVQRELDAGQLTEMSTRAAPLLNTIYVARIAEARPSRRVGQVIDWFFEMVGGPGAPRKVDAAVSIRTGTT